LGALARSYENRRSATKLGIDVKNLTEIEMGVRRGGVGAERYR
jgi:hypothetical protein